MDSEQQIAKALEQIPADQRQAYEVLQQLWQMLGFDAVENAPGQAELEFVMEKLWYAAPAAKTVK
jgi:hypothetical protein